MRFSAAATLYRNSPRKSAVYPVAGRSKFPKGIGVKGGRVQTFGVHVGDNSLFCLKNRLEDVVFWSLPGNVLALEELYDVKRDRRER